jgi:PAS domain S-box-containing protein
MRITLRPLIGNPLVTIDFDFYNLKKIIEHIPNFIFWKDLHSNYAGCNINFARFVGLTSSREIVGKADYDLPWTKDAADSYLAEDQEIIANKQPLLDKETSLITTDGNERIILINKVPLFDTHRNVIGILGNYSDITEQKK